MLEIAGAILLAYLVFVLLGGIVGYLIDRRYVRHGTRQQRWEAKQRKKAMEAERKRRT